MFRKRMFLESGKVTHWEVGKSGFYIGSVSAGFRNIISIGDESMLGLIGDGGEER